MIWIRIEMQASVFTFFDTVVTITIT